MRAILLGIVFTSMLAAPALAGDCSPLQMKNTIKLEPAAGGVMLVPITLNGREKKFLLDTGGGLNSVSEQVVQELKLVDYHSRYHTVDLHGNASDSFVQVESVILGRAQGGGIQFQVAPNLPFDGILSTGIFLHDDVDIDFGAKRLNLFSTDHCPGRVVYWPHAALSVVPVSLERGHIEVPVSLDGHSLTATLDTGSSLTELDLDRAKRKLGFSPDAFVPAGGPPDNPERQIYPRRFATLALNGISVANPWILIRPLTFSGGKNNPVMLGSRARHFDDEVNRMKPDMIIGMDILHHLHLYLAMDEEKLYVTEATEGESVLFKKPDAQGH
jgi:predicted aspartyl protease